MSWYAIFGPAGMPADVTRKLSADIAKALASPHLNARLRGLGSTPSAPFPKLVNAVLRSTPWNICGPAPVFLHTLLEPLFPAV